MLQGRIDYEYVGKPTPKTKLMKIKFKDVGRCLICIKNPCECEEEKHEDDCICRQCIKERDDAYDGSAQQGMDEVDRENRDAIIRDSRYN